MSAAEFQKRLVELLKEKFGSDCVINEWNAARDSRDGYNRSVYCPRIDIAIGPFNIDGDVQSNISVIKRKADETRTFLNKLIEKSISDTTSFEFNNNPRCFISIEIENSGSRKHMLGDIANASILGYMGIVIPIGRKKTNQFKKIKDYVDFAVRNGKTSKVFNNIVIVEFDNFLRVLKESSS